MNTQANIPQVEREVATHLIDAALAHNWTVSVYDGEAWCLKRSSNRDDILAAIASTDADNIRFRDADGRNMGMVVLVWGNDQDIIADYTLDDGGKFERFMDAVCEWVNTRFGMH